MGKNKLEVSKLFVRWFWMIGAFGPPDLNMFDTCFSQFAGR